MGTAVWGSRKTDEYLNILKEFISFSGKRKGDNSGPVLSSHTLVSISILILGFTEYCKLRQLPNRQSIQFFIEIKKNPRNDYRRYNVQA